ncbi:MAG: YfiT family bacillithiol transferase [Saprospiraceae bacterium]
MSINRRYPLGTMEESIAGDIDFDACVQAIRDFPRSLCLRFDDLSESELALTYREDSWDIKTLVHHCADSHMHAILRIKWALTEDVPGVNGYNEGPTATLADYALPIEASLSLLDGLHARLAHLLDSLTPEERKRTYLHTGHNKTFTIAETAAMYAWHGKHHLAHIELALGLLK